MLKSMTGFARAASESHGYDVVVEVRSVNHRYLDVKMRTSGGMAELEKRVRDRVGETLTRGKVDLSLRLTPQGESAQAIELDRPLMEEFVRVARELGEELEVGTRLTLADVVGFSPAFRVRERELADADALWDALAPVLADALDALDGMRGAEGASLERDFDERVKAIVGHVEQVAEASESKREERRAQLEERVAELLGSAAEPASVAMDVARLVERSDVAEELTRLRSHVELWRSTVAGGGACGKKLDFIVQEMNREVNTIGSKCQDAEIAETVIALKSEIERIREQVQNIE